MLRCGQFAMENRKKALKISVRICTAILFFIIIDATVIIVLGNIRPDCAPADAIIVLGSGHGNTAIERADKGLAFFRAGKSGTILFSGGKTDFSVSEAAFMSMIVEKQLGSSTLPATQTTPHILLDETSKNTHENLTNARAELPNATSVIIVTDTFHIARSVWSAQTAGFAHVCWGSPNPSYIPAFTLLQDYTREIVALPGYMLEYSLKVPR